MSVRGFLAAAIIGYSIIGEADAVHCRTGQCWRSIRYTRAGVDSMATEKSGVINARDGDGGKDNVGVVGKGKLSSLLAGGKGVVLDGALATHLETLGAGMLVYLIYPILFIHLILSLLVPYLDTFTFISSDRNSSA